MICRFDPCLWSHFPRREAGASSRFISGCSGLLPRSWLDTRGGDQVYAGVIVW